MCKPHRCRYTFSLQPSVSELPAETVRHCWAPLQAAYDDMSSLHEKAALDLVCLFPNKQAPIPDGNEEELEEEPSSDADDDFDYEEPVPRNEQTRADAEAERVEHNRAADLAVAQGIPRRAPTTLAALPPQQTRPSMDALNQRGELV